MLYHSGHILVLAKRAYERSKKDSSEAMPAILLSAVALECFVNDFAHQSAQHIFGGNEGRFRALSFCLSKLESERASLLKRIEAIHFFLTDREIEKGELIWQDVAFLVRLRNELVHRKPESVGDWPMEDDYAYEPHKFVAHLASRKIIDLPSEKAPPVWSQFVIDPKVAKWSYNTAVGAIKNTVSMVPPGLLNKVTKTATAHLLPLE